MRKSLGTNLEELCWFPCHFDRLGSNRRLVVDGDDLGGQDVLQDVGGMDDAGTARKEALKGPRVKLEAVCDDLEAQIAGDRDDFGESIVRKDVRKQIAEEVFGEEPLDESQTLILAEINHQIFEVVSAFGVIGELRNAHFDELLGKRLPRHLNLRTFQLLVLDGGVADEVKNGDDAMEVKIIAFQDQRCAGLPNGRLTTCSGPPDELSWRFDERFRNAGVGDTMDVIGDAVVTG